MSEKPPEEPTKDPIRFGQLLPGLLVAAIATPIVVAVGFALAETFGGSGVARLVLPILVTAGWVTLIVFVYRRDRNFGLGMVLGVVTGVVIIGSCLGMLATASA